MSKLAEVVAALNNFEREDAAALERRAARWRLWKDGRRAEVATWLKEFHSNAGSSGRSRYVDEEGDTVQFRWGKRPGGVGASGSVLVWFGAALTFAPRTDGRILVSFWPFTISERDVAPPAEVLIFQPEELDHEKVSSLMLEFLKFALQSAHPGDFEQEKP